jgi:hypothetical protein
VSRDAAGRDYGVVIDPTGGLDRGATEALRRRRAGDADSGPDPK